ncbi:Gibberellin 2-beta-dioxygenase [Actinidia chinensis var. chinensis]|uniref:gibberellin 2beta-dioxygenase n=1 Tax=Actinidia chinensis var. chinensis TaxID=1590841 RepID=A0A2R6QAG6_ACTCC|nr:Gibberellin 2-beta-dioxygenase [Actinidia chinensis var. chinensis]
MVVLSQPALDQFSLIQTCQYSTSFFNNIPSIDLSSPNAKALTVEACQGFGFFKVTNHGVPLEFMANLESEAIEFFNLPQCDKDKALGYGNRRIGPNGDVGWVEYLLLSASPELIHQKNPESFRNAPNDYVSSVKRVASEVLELIAQGLGIEPRNAFSHLLKDQKSDSLFRINHYPPCLEPLQQLITGENVVGFGEHTDPQLISVLRSNNISGLELCLTSGSRGSSSSSDSSKGGDGTWVSVPPDKDSLFISVGDCLQVMTNGRFKSVRHRVSANNLNSRISMIYFGGPPLNTKIAPLPQLMEEGEESLYQEFTWEDYKKSAYNSKLGDNRLGFFEKSSGQ